MANFTVEKIRIVKEEVAGTIPENPVVIEALFESYGLKEEQSSEDINEFGTGGDASPKSFGSSTFSGSISLVASSDNMPILCTHIAGTPLTTADATATAYPTTETAVAVGEIFNHSDDKHSLTCTVAGTTSGTEPTLEDNPNDDRGAKIVDGTATFIALPLLKQYTFERKQHMVSFTIEYELKDPQGNQFFKRFSNQYLNAFPVTMSGDTISFKVSGDILGTDGVDSTSAEWNEELTAKSGAKIVSLFKDYYSYEDCLVTFDDVSVCRPESVEANITRNVTVKNALNKCKNVSIGNTTISGNVNTPFEVEDFTKFKNHEDFKLAFLFTKRNGCKANIIFPRVKPMASDPVLEIGSQAYLNTELAPYGEGNAQSFNMEVIAPALVDSAGAIVGAY